MNIFCKDIQQCHLFTFALLLQVWRTYWNITLFNQKVYKENDCYLNHIVVTF